MRKATAKKYYIRKIYGDLGQLVNARQEISRGNGAYGVNWKFREVSKKEFLEELEKDDKVYCIETLSGKFKEIDKYNKDNFIL